LGVVLGIVGLVIALVLGGGCLLLAVVLLPLALPILLLIWIL
jgi:hypothetical protein